LARWRLFRRIVEIIRREGPASLWFRWWAFLGYRRTMLLVCELSEAREPPAARLQTRSGRLGPDDVDAYLLFRRGATRADYLERLDHGFECHAVWHGARIASVTWTARRRAILWLLDSEFDVPERTLYLFDSYTHSDFRGRRLQGRVFMDLREMAEAQGLERFMTFVIPENRANLRSRGRMGFKRAGRVGRLGWGRWVLYWTRGKAPEMRRRQR
jgi:ribosomal protein S18 acetylase RimI-like enzyme